MDISHIRHDFTAHVPLSRNELSGDPFVQFERWFTQALNVDIPEPNAFVLSTVNAQHQPSQRSVLLKYFDRDGFVFFTNYQSRKAQDIDANQNVSLLFPWFALQRQVKIEGVAEKISRVQSLRYFLSRPRESQIGAWSSPQSQVIESRALLLQTWLKMKERFAGGDISLPDFWGGYQIRPHCFEFWQGQPNRLHDRFVYHRQPSQLWSIERLAP